MATEQEQTAEIISKLDAWELQIDTGERTDFYLDYYSITAVDGILETAAISQFSGAIGGAANVGNFLAKVEIGDSYPDIEFFSKEVSLAIHAAIEANLDNSGNGILSDLDVAMAARNAWITVGSEHDLDVQLQDYFPGNAEIIKEAIATWDSNIFNENLSDDYKAILTSILSGDGNFGELPDDIGNFLTPLGNEILFSKGTRNAVIAGLYSTAFGYNLSDYQNNPAYSITQEFHGTKLLDIVRDSTGNIVYIDKADGFISGYDSVLDGVNSFFGADGFQNDLRDSMNDSLGGGLGGRPRVVPSVNGNMDADGNVSIENTDASGRIIVTNLNVESNSLNVTQYDDNGGNPVARSVDMPRIDGQGNLTGSTEFLEMSRDAQGIPHINGVSLIQGPTPTELTFDLTKAVTENPGVYSFDIDSIKIDGVEAAANIKDAIRRDLATQLELQIKEVALFGNFTDDGGFDDFLTDSTGNVDNVKFTEFGDGSFGYITTDGDGNIIATTKIKNGVAVRDTITVNDGIYSVDDSIVRETFHADDTHDVEVSIGDTTLSLGQIGSVFGSSFSSLIHTDNIFEQVGVSTVFSLVGQNLFQTVGFAAIDGKSLGDALNDAFGDLGIDTFNAGKGAVSSILAAEFIDVLGLDGVAAELGQSITGAALNQVITNLTTVGAGTFDNIGNLNVSSIVAGIVGNRLANAVYTPDTIGGQIGGAIGSAYGGIISIPAYAFGPVVGSIVTAINVFVYKIIGSLIGSLFGGTPRSGADVTFNRQTGEFGVGNIWSAKGGSKEGAEQLASIAAANLNGILAAIGGEVVNEGRLSGGTYGTRKSDYTYRVDGGSFGPGDPGKRTISKTFDGDDDNATTLLIEHGVLNALDDLEIAGGDVFLKRALYGSLDELMAGRNVQSSIAGEAINVILGNFQTANDYRTYIENAATINALIAAEPESAFTAGWIITLQRVSEVGLNKRHTADWLGGYKAWGVSHEVQSFGALSLNPYINAAGQSDRRFILSDENGFTRRIYDTVTQSSKTIANDNKLEWRKAA